LADGTHNIAFTVTDSAGNTSAPSDPLGLTIDTQAPATPPAPALSGGGTVSATSTPTLTGTAEPGSTVAVYDTVGGSTTLLGTTTADASGAWSFTTPPLGDGSHSLTVTATDPAGNTSAPSDPTSLTINAEPAPAAPTLASGGSTVVNDNTPTVTGTAEPGSTVAVYDQQLEKKLNKPALPG
jgi:hypothetical protein